MRAAIKIRVAMAATIKSAGRSMLPSMGSLGEAIHGGPRLPLVWFVADIFSYKYYCYQFSCAGTEIHWQIDSKFCQECRFPGLRILSWKISFQIKNISFEKKILSIIEVKISMELKKCLIFCFQTDYPSAI